MALDPSIALQVKPLKVDPLGDAQKGLALKQLLLGEQLRNAFVFDDTPEGPKMNMARTRQNLYAIDPQAAMSWERQNDMRDHWQSQRAYQAATLANAAQNRDLKARSLGIQELKAGIAGLGIRYMEDMRPDVQKIQEYTQLYQGLLQQYQNKLPVEGFKKQGMLPDSFDFNSIDKVLNTPDDDFIKTAGTWVAPAAAYTDEGDAVSPQHYDQEQPDTQERPEGFVQTGAPLALLDKIRSGGGGRSGADKRQQQIIEGGKLLFLARKIDASKPIVDPETGESLSAAALKQKKDFLMSRGISLAQGKGVWSEDSPTYFNSATMMWEPNELAVKVKERIAAAGRSVNNVNVNTRNEKDFAAADKLRDEFRNESKTFVSVRDAYTRVNASLSRAMKGGQINAAETLAAATSFMKMLDPNSVVRESELGMALAATGWFDRITNVYNTIKNGKVLTPAQIQNFHALAQELYTQAEEMHKPVEEKYTQEATAWNIDPSRVVIDYKIKRKKPDEVKVPAVAPKTGVQAAPTKKPKTGDVVDGYKFKGGDPKNRSNWVPVK